jgi:DNA-binding NarL/FixJ family response regulator
LNPLQVVLADDHALLRDMLRDRLEDTAQFKVAAATADADSAVAAVLKHRADVLVLDIDMPGRDVFDAAAVVRASSPATALLFLSSHYHDRYIQRAIELGARGYILKTRPPEEIVDAIRSVAQGGTSFSQEVMDRLIIEPKGVRLADASSTRLSQLSDRELEVLRYIASGLSKKEIAERMHLSVKTVQNHADRMMQKIDIHDRVELARFAIREGLVTP